VSERADGDAFDRYRADVERHYRWNLAAHLLYGLLGTTGWRLIMAPTFVPDYVFRLGGSNLAVGLLLFVGGLGRFASPLAGAAHVGHRPLVKPTAIRIGTAMRLQVLGMGVAPLVLPLELNLPVFVVLYCAFAVLNGLQGVVFGLLMAKVIPPGRRGRFIGLRDFAGGATAAGVAALAGVLLADVTFPASYGFTYLVAFAFTSLGLVCLGAIREPSAPVTAEPRTIAATVARARSVLAGDPGFAWYCAARALGALGLMAAPFFIIAAGRGGVTSARDLVQASVAFFAAGTVANLLWGRLADAVGFRAVFLVAALVWLAALGLALAPGPPSVVVLFGLVGVGQGGMQMASLNLVYDLPDHGDLGIRIAVVSALGELTVAIAPLVGGALADHWSYAALWATAAVFTVAATAVMWMRVPVSRARAAW
jgi:MFS family permease